MRIHHVNKARKDQGRCESCREEITAGQGYRYIAPRYGGKRKRHATCPVWRQSEMTSGKIATAYAAQEGGHDSLEALEPPTPDTLAAFVDDVKAILEEVATGADECSADYQDGFDNMPENFQNGPTGEEIQEKIDYLESWAEELRQWEPDDDWTDVDPDDVETWAEDVLSAAGDVIDSLEL